MKGIVLIVALFFSVGLIYSQKRGRMPGETSYGMKGFVFQSFPSAKSRSDLEVSHIDRVNTSLAFSVYAKHQFKSSIMIQSEVLFSSKVYHHFLSSDVKSFATSLSTTATVTTENELLVSYSTFAVPVYVKKVFEITPIRKGYSRYNQSIGLLFGPRIELNYLPKKVIASRETTLLYNQISRSVEYSEKSIGNDMVNAFGLGFSLGADWEMSNKFILHLQYYRSLMSVLKKDSGLKMFNNQIELGIGYRLY